MDIFSYLCRDFWRGKTAYNANKCPSERFSIKIMVIKIHKHKYKKWTKIRQWIMIES